MAMDKHTLREQVWDKMTEEKVGRFPFPLKGRIPNFKGAEKAASRVFKLDIYKKAEVVKVNPDSPQLPVRAQVLKDGKILLVPTPRLKDGFILVDPENVPAGEEKTAASLKNIHNYGSVVPLKDLPKVDLLFAGSVAVHRDGRRIGKGEGYADREYAILRELGNPPMPVVGTVHPVQVVSEDFHTDDFDLTLDYIVTEIEVIETGAGDRKPSGIHWDRVTDEEKEAMPVLEEIRELTNKEK
ncbi:5-formyltetrahydrofolate cyclo-ligase [Salipaludibacillus aurantiacus]|uniref:5-formyltetrahydrofolate cyclo-ligase n=1 Tax=Salipaludibacillus aurantiacus TaxID=1601833 RepID=A0A1H9VAX0_9BACI|nr:5-formyltetrahydrofolate cyclo-ligase [Salipaludibacillus aurantiacus]SES18387.1 5-formyltetrahydrofolate cyclo-ligase [Salipaludibacillus aurantiacus]